MRFTAYYTEDRVYRGNFDDWLEIPPSGALVVIEHLPTGRTIFTGGDWYYVVNNKFYYVPSGDWGTQREKPIIKCNSCIKEGVGVSDAIFKDVVDRAMKETHGNI